MLQQIKQLCKSNASHLQFQNTYPNSILKMKIKREPDVQPAVSIVNDGSFTPECCDTNHSTISQTVPSGTFLQYSNYFGSETTGCYYSEIAPAKAATIPAPLAPSACDDDWLLAPPPSAGSPPPDPFHDDWPFW